MDRYLNSISTSLHDVETRTSRCLRRWSCSGSTPLQIASPRWRRHSPRGEPTPSRIASQVSLPVATHFSCPSLARASHFYALVSAHCNPHSGNTLLRWCIIHYHPDCHFAELRKIIKNASAGGFLC